MDHLSDGRMLAYLDRELPGPDRERVRAHLSGCDACRTGLERLRERGRLFGRAVARVDRPAPEPVRHRSGPGRFVPTASTRSFLKAALLVLTLGGAAAAAVSHTARGWIGATVEQAVGLITGAEAPDAGTTTVALEEPTAVSVRAAEDGFRVEVLRPRAGTAVRIRVTGGEEARVRATRARFHTAPGRIDVLEAGGGEVRVELPASEAARVLVDGRPVAVKEAGGDLRAVEPGRSSDDEVVVPAREATGPGGESEGGS